MPPKLVFILVVQVAYWGGWGIGQWVGRTAVRDEAVKVNAAHRVGDVFVWGPK